MIQQIQKEARMDKLEEESLCVPDSIQTHAISDLLYRLGSLIR